MPPRKVYKARVPKEAPRRMAPRRQVRRGLMSKAPTFTETLALPNVPANNGGVFSFSIDQVPQLAQYADLYRQYKINWAQVKLICNTNSYDPMGFTQGMPRISWAVNDTPALVPPVNEADLLTDNGVKTRALTTQWQQSCKPTPDLSMTDAGGGLIPVRQRKSPYLNFMNAGANPRHYGISYWISQSLAGGAPVTSFDVYLKINFSLRDPK